MGTEIAHTAPVKHTNAGEAEDREGEIQGSTRRLHMGPRAVSVAGSDFGCRDGGLPRVAGTGAGAGAAPDGASEGRPGIAPQSGNALLSNL